MKTKLEIIRINEDVISTSNQIIIRGELDSCLYFTSQEAIAYVGKKSTDGVNTVNYNNMLISSFKKALKNVYGEGSNCQFNQWYALYTDGTDLYAYKHEDTPLSEHTHSVSD